VRGRANAAMVRSAAAASATWPARERSSQWKPTSRGESGGEGLVKAVGWLGPHLITGRQAPVC
jgi:hypothetical protein